MRYFASDTVTLHSMVARLNIELFGKKLAEEMNEAKRRILLQLVAEDKGKTVGAGAVGGGLDQVGSAGWR